MIDHKRKINCEGVWLEIDISETVNRQKDVPFLSFASICLCVFKVDLLESLISLTVFWTSVHTHTYKQT